MKRTVYGTWAQIKHVITQNNKLNKLQPGAGYDSYEVVPVTQPLLPPEPLENKHHRPYIYMMPIATNISTLTLCSALIAMLQKTQNVLIHP